MVMIERIKCWLGFHTWVPLHEVYSDVVLSCLMACDKSIVGDELKCKRCGRWFVKHL